MLDKLLGNNTPQYLGADQASAQKRGGLLGLLAGLFGGAGTPAYAGSAQPQSSQGGGFALFPQTPPYHRPAPAVPVASLAAAAELPAPADADVSGVERPAKAITIIVRPGPGTTVEEVARFLQDRVLDD